MNQCYDQNYTREEVSHILSIIKSCVENNNYYISYNEHRQENINFINEYNITVDRQKSILKQIEIDDFCYSTRNYKSGYEHEILYVFAPEVHLFKTDNFEEIVNIYIKINLLNTRSGSRAVVISFHKLNRPINYLFH